MVKSTSPSPSGAGHLFVVHGRIEGVLHDVAIVPTASDFHVRGYWKPILGEDTKRWRPPEWPGRGYAKAGGRDDVWFVNVGGRHGAGVQILIERVVAALREIATTGLTPSRNRVKPLVAVPVLGIAGGGLGRERGDVVRRLLTALADAASELDLDVAIVTPDASVYGAAQHLRRQTPKWPLPANQVESAQQIGSAARRGDLALFMGAGVSIPAGLPTWNQLLTQLADGHSIDVGGGFGSLNALDQAQYLHSKVPQLGDAVARIVSKAQVPALGHGLLAALRCPEAVTTNYDRLYEGAIEMQRGEGNVATVMPWEHPSAGKPWVLKMHGDVQRPKTIVLTRQQFVRYDAETRPAGALLQTLLMTRHVLFVGASLNDDNVVRLAYEVDRFRQTNGLEGVVGTLLDVDNDPVRQELWSGQLAWLNMSGSTIAERSRTLEIFLDAVAAHASDDSSWLLDERFKGLLDLDEALVREARSLYQRAANAGPEWKGLTDALLGLGAASGEYNREREDRRWSGWFPGRHS